MYVSVSKDESEERSVRQPDEGEDAADDKELNKLSEDIEKLNIKPENKDDDELFTQRGPTGGVAVQQHAIRGQKNIPSGPMGNYMPPQMVYPPSQMKGNRRTLDEAEDQPQKYFRPPAFNYAAAPMPKQQSTFSQQFGNTANFGANFTQTQQNNLSQSLGQSQRFNFSPQQDYQFNNLTTTNVRNAGNMSGGKVIVQSPVAGSQPSFPNNNFADDFLAKIVEQPYFSLFSHGNLPHFTFGQLGSNWEPSMVPDSDFTKDSFTEIRRRSDPVDSGIESEGGSPMSEQAPSPSSYTYTSPPSVESGCGISPIHESQYQHGVSPPKYPGVMSPGSYRPPPSPANTSGYGSPGQPILEEDLINDELLEDALAVITDDLNTDEKKKKQRQKPVSSQQSLPPNNVPQPSRFNQQLMCQPLQNHQVPPQAYTGIPVTTTGGQQQIIIIQPQQQNNQPLILVPVKTSPAPAKKKTAQTQYKKILPKLSQAPNSSTTGSASVTIASSTVQTTSTKGGSHLNRSATQPNSQGIIIILIFYHKYNYDLT